jgi:hypothetical protein
MATSHIRHYEDVPVSELYDWRRGRRGKSFQQDPLHRYLFVD